MLLLLLQAPATAAEFFALVPGIRRTYEVKSEFTATIVDEVGTKPALFDGLPAYPILQQNEFRQVIGTTFYRVDGATVLSVGEAEERRKVETENNGTIDTSRPVVKVRFLMQYRPPMPVFKYEGKETSWVYAEIPKMEDRDPDPLNPGGTKVGTVKTLDETSIRGTAKPGKERTVLGRKVETIEVRQEVQLGLGKFAQKIVETSVYGRGIGLIEAVRKATVDRKTQETRTKLIAIEEPKKEGG